MINKKSKFGVFGMKKSDKVPSDKMSEMQQSQNKDIENSENKSVHSQQLGESKKSSIRQ